MPVVTYPGPQTIDDAGALITGAAVTIDSVTDKAGTPIASHGATVNVAGSNVSVDYDAEAHGDAWVNVAVSKSGSTITGANATVALFCSRDPGRIVGYLDAPVSANAPAQVWASVTRTLTDKTGYQLSIGEHIAVAADVQTGLTAQGYTTARAAKIDNADALVSSRLAASGYTAPPTDYQQRGVAVTLPAAPAGYGGASAGQVAAAILATPANLLATDGTGKVGVNNFPATVSLASGDETVLSNFASMVTGTGAGAKFTALALSLAPTGSGGGGGPVIVAGYDTGMSPAEQLAVPTAVAIRQEIDANSTQLAAISAAINPEIAAILAAVDTEVAAVQTAVNLIKAKTDNLPSDPAGLTSLMAEVIETGITFRQLLRALGAVTAGNYDGTAFKALGNSGTTRVTPTITETERTNALSL